jgi:hypothetical protein
VCPAACLMPRAAWTALPSRCDEKAPHEHHATGSTMDCQLTCTRFPQLPPLFLIQSLWPSAAGDLITSSQLLPWDALLATKEVRSTHSSLASSAHGDPMTEPLNEMLGPAMAWQVLLCGAYLERSCTWRR